MLGLNIQAGLCPANGAAGAPDKNTGVSVNRQPRQRCALVRPAEPISYNPSTCHSA